MAQLFDVTIERAFYYRLFDVRKEYCDKRLEYVDDIDLESLNATDGPGAPRQIRSADGRRSNWMTVNGLQILETALAKLTKLDRIKLRGFTLWRLEIIEAIRTLSEKHIAMPNLLRLCLQWLAINPI